MNDLQTCVEHFNRAINTERGSTPAIRAPELRVKLVKEEAKELTDAIEAGDLVKAIDGICDLLYVTLGTADAFGIDVEPFFFEVHATNMKKIGGPISPDGKQLKPEGWQPPRIAEILQQLIDGAE